MAFELDIVKTTTADNTQSTFSMYMTIGAIEDTPGNMTLNKVNYKALLIDLNFDKKIYQPCKMVAKLQITREDGTTPSQDDLSYYLFNLATLQTTFMKAAVALYQLEKNDDGDTIRTEVLKNHVVYDVTPHYTSQSLYVDLTIYSPDYALTTDIKSQTFVAKQLGKEILKGLFTNSNSYVKNKLRYAAEADEYIHPYLVQYNESFFDLLTRTANRWGEFVYYEDGELIVGRKPFKDPDDQNKDDIKVIESYTSLSFENWSADPTLLANSKKTVTTDRYLETIEKDEFIEHAGDMKSGGDHLFFHRMFQSIFSIKDNVWDWMVNWLIDEGIYTAQNKNYLDFRKDEYNNHFFANTSDTKHYDTSGNKYCQFAYYDGEKGTRGLTQNAYADVLSKELIVGKEVLVMNMGTAYPKLRLGDVFTFSGASDPKPKYLVIGVECRDSTKITESYIDTSNSEEQKRVKVDVWAAHYYIHAIKQSNTPSATIAAEFYPPMLKTGHIRFSGPQRATIADTLDPMLNGRYRVRSTWQGSSDAGSPWLKVAREMMGDKSGSVWELKEGTDVLLDFEDGNVELPYIVGVLQNDEKRANNRASMFNVMDLTTPCGHAIRLNDGAGGGSSNFIASFIPAASWAKGLAPQKGNDRYKTGEDKFYDGGMELTDKYGIYSIKASTDKRNITINSPYGDVQLNAFTGITISAPNGDVKIQGKNVSIEAGNNVSIVSGKNISNGFLGSIVAGGGRKITGGAVGSMVLDIFTRKLANWCDLSVIRDAIEIFLRPIHGTMQLKSSRNMVLQAGLNTQSHDDIPSISNLQKEDWSKWVQKNWKTANFWLDFTDRYYNRDDTDVWRAPQYGTILFKCVTNKAQYFKWNDVYGNSDAVDGWVWNNKTHRYEEQKDYSRLYNDAANTSQDWREDIKRFAVLEGRVGTLRTDVDDIKRKVETLRTDVDDINDITVKSLRTAIRNINTANINTDTDLRRLTARFDDLMWRINVFAQYMRGQGRGSAGANARAEGRGLGGGANARADGRGLGVPQNPNH